MMNPREQRALAIAPTNNLTRKDVLAGPTKSSNKHYTVCPDPKIPTALGRTTKVVASGASTFRGRDRRQAGFEGTETVTVRQT